MPDDPLVSIVDDDESFRLALAGLVRSLGYRARPFASAEEFLAWPALADSSCIVTDIHMPGLGGFDMIERLEAAGCAAPVIMVTGRSEASLHDRARQFGALCLLRKPFDERAFVDCLEAALLRSSGSRDSR